MRKSSIFFLAGVACGGAGSAWAQTPAPGLMPDGSYDMYAGVGVRSAPNYEGGDTRKTRPMPVLQVAWSNGAFISGMTAGMHLSSTPGLVYGPLLSFHPGRSKDGAQVFDAADVTTASASVGIITLPAELASASGEHAVVSGEKARVLYRLRNIGARAEGGFFVNYYLGDRLRLTNNVLYGAGEQRNGLRWTVDLQRGAIELAPHHTLALTAGATFGNRAYNTGYFGLRTEDVLDVLGPVMVVMGGEAPPPPKNPWAYSAAGGIKDIHAGVRWNWALSPSWMLTTNVQVTQLRGGAKRSPLAERATGVTVSAGLAYRF